jgi:hypothetical protein
MSPLAIEDAGRLCADELSALCLGPSAPPGADLVAVSDASFRIVKGTSRPLGGSRRSPSLRAFVEERSHKPKKGSQWEGVAADGAGLLFVLQEHAGSKQPPHVFGFAHEVDALVAVISLNVGNGDAEWRRAWRADPNARAEAIVLLRKGHLLVIKQKDPIRLIEFGPAGSESRGLGAGQLAGPAGGERFLPRDSSSVEYEALASWAVDSGHEEPLASINDAAVAAGALYVVSRSSRRIAQLDSGGPGAADSVRVARSWQLPPEIENPEGLVLLDDLAPIIADDQPENGPAVENVFRLQRLPAGGD